MSSLSDISAPAVELKDVHVVFGTTLALDIESLRIEAGERVFLLGRSGSGKTTLSRAIKGRLRPTTGMVRVLGADPAAEDSGDRRRIQRRIAMIDQEFHLVPRMTVMDNILMGCLGRLSVWKSLLSWYPSGELEKAAEILSEVELEGLGNRRVDQLSGGQRQRTGIARALMQDAAVILADEPVSNLDPELAEEALDLLVACVARRNETLIVNLHQPSLARRFATRIIGLSDGKIVYDGPPEKFTASEAEFLYQAGAHDPEKVVAIERVGPKPRAEGE